MLNVRLQDQVFKCPGEDASDLLSFLPTSVSMLLEGRTTTKPRSGCHLHGYRDDSEF